MKNIIIISPDAVPLTLKEGCPTTIKEGNIDFPIKDKCVRVTATGKRAWMMAHHLSFQKDFDVTLLIPELNFPPREFIDTSEINFNIQPYNYKAANWEWSAELDRRLKKYDFVIVQSTTGTGFINCSVLPRSVNVILDGYVPLFAELPCALLNYERIYRKIFWTKKFLHQYLDLIRRANCVLYANDRQHYYYEGQFFVSEKLDWSSFKFSPLLKVPFGIDKHQKIERKQNNTDILHLLWYGSAYPWYAPEVLLKAIKDRKDIKVDFVGIIHPRYKKVYNSYFKRIFDMAKEEQNVRIIEDYCDDTNNLFSKYDAGIIIARNWLEEKYSHRCRILDMSSRGFPVILNEGNSLYEESPQCLKNILHPVSTSSLLEDLLSLKEKKSNLDVSQEILDEAYNKLGWESVLSPLIDYIRKF